MKFFNFKKRDTKQKAVTQKHAQAPEAAPKKATAYQQAYNEWDERIGQAKTQLKNWRLLAILSMGIIVLVLIAFILMLKSDKQYVYIAKIEPGETVAQLQPVTERYQPSQAQLLHFAGQFVRHIMSQPLDPVVVRNNWFAAYAVVQGKAIDQLTQYAQQNNPLQSVGSITKTVSFQSAHALGDQSYELRWQQTSYSAAGKVISVHQYSGLFTIIQGAAPKDIPAMMQNPLGLKIVYFSFTKEE